MTPETLECSLPAVFSEPFDRTASVSYPVNAAVSCPEADSRGLIRGLISATVLYFLLAIGCGVVWKLWHFLS
jgi:hypothetical protein